MSDEVHTLIGAYVLDAVDDVERAAVRRHLAECAECAAEAAELAATAARLGGAAAVAPPPGLRENVLREVARTRQAGPERRAGDGPSAVRRWRGWTAAAVAAGIIAAGAGAATYAVQEQRVRAERTQAAEVAAVLAAPDARVARVDVPGGGRVSVVVSNARDEAVVVLDEMPAVDRAHAYQLWRMRGTQATDAGVLPAGDTSATRVVKGLAGVDGLAVSKEPAGGSHEPTLPPVASVSLRA